jgi:hypothetical protein
MSRTGTKPLPLFPTLKKGSYFKNSADGDIRRVIRRDEETITCSEPVNTCLDNGIRVGFMKTPEELMLAKGTTYTIFNDVTEVVIPKDED